MGTSDDRAEVDVKRLTDWLTAAAQPLEQRHVDRGLLRAQIADHYRRLGMDPADPGTFEALTDDLVPEAWRRLALLIQLLEVDGFASVLANRMDANAARQLEYGFIALARNHDRMTMEVLHANRARAEEWARLIAQAFETSVSGETEDTSAIRLADLDSRPRRRTRRPSATVRPPSRTGRRLE